MNRQSKVKLLNVLNVFWVSAMVWLKALFLTIYDISYQCLPFIYVLYILSVYISIRKGAALDHRQRDVERDEC